GEPVVDLELVLAEGAHLLLVIDEMRFAGALRVSGGQVICVVLEGRLKDGDAIGRECGAEDVGAKGIGVVIVYAAIHVRKADPGFDELTAVCPGGQAEESE